MSNFKILIVDDLIESLKVIVLHLQHSNPEYTLYQSNSSVKAIEIAQKVLPDLIITDWDMPELNGIELIRKLKSIESTKDIPFVVASGVMITSNNLKIALEAGAVDFLRKPIDPIELQARINSALIISKYHKESIEAKNRELMEITLNLTKNKEFTIDLKNKLQRITTQIHSSKEISIEINKIIELLDEKIRTKGWDQFNIAFHNVKPHFYKNLLEKFPDLSPAETKLCALITLGMSIKDISSLLNQSPDGVKVSRSRLRKKLSLDTNQNLESFLCLDLGTHINSN
jgi:CheY-like chemotaxis protein/DNA-binding CsgD family transcriptional regulator